MKKIHSVYLIALLATALAAIGCTDDSTASDASSGISSQSWSNSELATAAGAEKTYRFSAAGSWTAKSDVEWCRLLDPSGSRGNDQSLNIVVDPNSAEQTRYARIRVSVGGFSKSSEFTFTQLGTKSGGTGRDLDLNVQVDELLREKYLWNEEYKALSPAPDRTIDYVGTNDNFVYHTLMRMTANTFDKKSNGQGGYKLYSFLKKTGTTTTKSTRGVTHGIEKKLETSFGITQMYNNNSSLTIAGVRPGSPAAQAGLTRGTTFNKVNGETINSFNAYNFFSILVDPVSNKVNTVTVTTKTGVTAKLTTTPFYPSPIIHSEIIDGSIGYLVYDGFDAAYDDELLEVIKTFKNAGISNLILDLRYNGGGYVISSKMLSTCIAGSQCSDKVYQYYRYNDARMAAKDQTATQTGNSYDASKNRFYEKFSYGKYYSVNLTDYALNLNQLYVLVSENTASASEAVINSLRGIGIKVVLVGKPTNGKNVGMELRELTSNNTTYDFAPITFQSYNANMDSVNPQGFVVNKELNEYLSDGSILSYSDRNEPLVAAALAMIKGKSSPATKASASAVSPRFMTNERPSGTIRRCEGMIALPPEQ